MAVCHAEFQRLGAEILAINVNSTLDHKVWNEVELSRMVEGGIPYPILSDPTGEIGRLYGVYDQNQGKSVRATFIVDPQGKIEAAEILTSAVGRNPAEILRQLKAYQLHLATGEAIPCAWQEGDKTIIPSLDKAGKVWQEWSPEATI